MAIFKNEQEKSKLPLKIQMLNWFIKFFLSDHSTSNLNKTFLFSDNDVIRLYC